MNERDFIFEGFKELDKDVVASLPLKERLQYLYLKERKENARWDKLLREQDEKNARWDKLVREQYEEPMWECDVCHIQCQPTSKNRHLKSKKHLKKSSLQPHHGN